MDKSKAKGGATIATDDGSQPSNNKSQTFQSKSSGTSPNLQADIKSDAKNIDSQRTALKENHSEATTSGAPGTTTAPSPVPKKSLEKDRSNATTSATPITSRSPVPKKDTGRGLYAWDKNFSLMTQYKQSHGSCDVPYRGSLRYLAKWAGRIRSGEVKISAEQKGMLDAIGFDWSTLQEKEEKTWMRQYNSLVAYKDRTGDTRVPANFEEDRELGHWVANQRKRRRNLRLDRIKMLDKIGFVWIVRPSRRTKPSETKSYDLKWRDMFRRLESYKKKNGNCNVPYNYEIDPSLGLWVTSQRQVYQQKTWRGKDSEMQKERVMMLQKIGFNFGTGNQNLRAAKKDKIDKKDNEKSAVRSD